MTKRRVEYIRDKVSGNTNNNPKKKPRARNTTPSLSPRDPEAALDENETYLTAEGDQGGDGMKATTARKVSRGAIHADRKRGGASPEVGVVESAARYHDHDKKEGEEEEGEEAGADFLAELRERFAPSEDELASEEDLALAEDGALFGDEEDAERVTAPASGRESDLEIGGGGDGGAAIGVTIGEGLTTESLDAGCEGNDDDDDAVTEEEEEGDGVSATVEASRKIDVESEAVLTTSPAVGEGKGTGAQEGTTGVTGVTPSVLLLEDIKTMKVQYNSSSRRGKVPMRVRSLGVN